MTNYPPITIGNTQVYCVYAYNVIKNDNITSQDSETGDEILYLIRRNVYTLNISFKCNAQTGVALDNAITNNVLLSITFMDKGVQKTAIMRVTSYEYSCISMYGKEIWDISLSLKESYR